MRPRRPSVGRFISYLVRHPRGGPSRRFAVAGHGAPPVLTEGDRRQAAIQTPRTERADGRGSGSAAGQMRAGRSKPTPFHLGEDGGNGRGAGRWYVSGCGR